MLDRTLNQDGMRGQGQGIRDNTLTPNRLRPMFESRSARPIKGKRSGFPSLQAHMTYLHLVHTIHILPQKSSVSAPSLISQHSFLSVSLLCDVHLPNIWSLQLSYDGPITPSDDSALLLHRLGLDCGISSHGLHCTDTQGKVVILRIPTQKPKAKRSQKQ
ncbi:alpha-mannosidase 2-like [Ostrea edulis]|uniref:alpha-mannosidase 2-like n=1 Tax=Ostrea edulis TaxID=37623 RepID=UPI0024AF692D|nr:alpha-mannosidase 2-like [Ostrea edulis]